MQEWVVEQVQFGHNGEPDQDVLEMVLITDETHRIRSASAENDTRSAAAAHPLPAEARGGGAPASDPNSREQILLSKGAACYVRSSLMICRPNVGFHCAWNRCLAVCPGMMHACMHSFMMLLVAYSLC